jgi:putative AdoMet-dependent methyltransferase
MHIIIGGLHMGREFDPLFDEWAATYDDTVAGHDIEYKEVFLHYDDILNEIAKRAIDNVLEFGVGTGNLTKKLLNKGLDVIGIEPSKEMRTLAKQKINQLEIYDGDFLLFPTNTKPIQTIVSSYAFHHLTDEEKNKAISIYTEMLPKDGKIVFADTMFASEHEKTIILEETKKRGYNRLLADLQTEYYSTIPFLKQNFEKHGFAVQFHRMNKFVWILEAVKK